MTTPPGVVPFDQWTIRGRWWPVTLRRRLRSEASVVHHSVTDTTGDTDLAQAQQIEEVIYRRRLKARFSMVAYSYIIGTDATVFEGRGVTYRNAANNDTKNTGLTNTVTVSFCFAGNYHPDVAGVPTLTPTVKQLAAAGDVIAWLELSGDLEPDADVVPHRYVHATACPGDNLASEVSMIAAFAHMPPEAPDLEEDLMAPSAPLVQLYDDPDAERTLAMWAGPDGRPVVYSYGTYRPGVGIPGNGLSWVALAMFTDDRWVNANP